jgi:hypothetical protein
LPIFISSPDYKSGGLHYDKTDAKEDTVDSPYGIRWAMKLVDKEFAIQAIAEFPDEVSEMTEVEAEDFWNNKAYAHVSAQKRQPGILESLKAELDLRTELSLDTTAIRATIAKALDENDPEPGVVKNDNKTWADMKAKAAITIVDTKA